MTEIEYEYEGDLGTIASKEKRADEEQIFSLPDIEQSLAFFNRPRPRLLSDSDVNIKIYSLPFQIASSQKQSFIFY